MISIPRANVQTSTPTFHGARVERMNPGPVYFGVGAVAVVAISLIFVGVRSTRPRRGASEPPDGE